MPTTISFMDCAICFCVGFFTGSGWALGGWIIARILR